MSMGGPLQVDMAGPLEPVRRSGHVKEAELDHAIEGMLGTMLGGPGHHGPLLRGGPMPAMGGPLFGGPLPMGGDVVIETDGPGAGPGPGLPGFLQGPGPVMPGPAGPPKGLPSLFGPMGPLGGPPMPGHMPPGMFHNLFPGPLMEVEVTEGPDGTVVEEHSSSAGGVPDPIVADMLQDFGKQFEKEILPALHKAEGARRAPASCHADLNKLCYGIRKKLHCLGQHREEVSEECRRDVNQSVPFLCAGEISNLCGETSVLSCLYGAVDQLHGPCKNAVLLTQRVVDEVKTQKVTVTNPTTGEKKVHVPTPEPAKQKERRLDARMAGKVAAAAGGKSATPDSPRPAAAPKDLAALQEANLDVLLTNSAKSPQLAGASGAAKLASHSSSEAGHTTQSTSWLTVALRTVAMLGAVAGFAYFICRGTDVNLWELLGRQPGLGDGREPLKGGLPANTRPPLSL